MNNDPLNSLTKIRKKTFWVLLLGFVVILVSSFFVLLGSRPLFDPIHNQRLVTAQIMQIYHLVDQANATKISVPPPPHFSQLNISDAPMNTAQIIDAPNPIKIFNYMMSNPNKRSLGLQLHNGKWLNIIIKSPWPKFWLGLIGPLLLLSVLLCCLVFLCLWSVKRLTLPLEKLFLIMHNPNYGENIVANTGNADVDKIIAEFQQLNARINKLMKVRTQMLAAISHDLKTPITRLKLRVEYLPDDRQYQKALHDLAEMDNMISSVLAYTRDDANNGPLERFDMNALLESITHDFSDAGFDVSYQGMERPVSFYGSISNLRRAFNNLIDNAIKYGKQAKIKMTSDNKEIQILIDDAGPGIAKEHVEQVFEPFFRVEASRSRETGGVGLGLTIARDIIMAHHGDIQLQNLSQSGLRVSVKLPIS